MHEHAAEYDELVELHGWIALAKHMSGIVSDDATTKRELRFMELRAFLLETHSSDEYDLHVREALDRAVKKSEQVGHTQPPTPPPQPQPPQPDFTKLVSDAFRDGTPFGEIWNESRVPEIDWSTDERSTKKGYVCACLSELVYQQMSQFEVRGKDRYRVIPSLMLRELLERNIAIDVARMNQNRDIPTTVIDTANFVFGVFNFYQYTIIAVRGTTKTLSDWMLDFDARKVNINGLGYHHGFFRDAEDALPALIMATPANNNPIYFTGHSLGGAIAGLLPQIWQGPGRIMTPYTFASPRFGTKEVAAKSNVYAYVRALDPVPHIPLEIMGYRSSGWPPVVIPTGDRWLSNWEMAAHWKELLPAHSMEQYRKLMGEECDSKYFPVDVYLKALKTSLVDYPDEIP